MKSPDSEILSISLWDERPPHSFEFGFVKIPIKTLKDQEKREEWFPLQPLTQEEISEKPGEILIKVKYTEQLLLPGPLYDEFFTVFHSANCFQLFFYQLNFFFLANFKGRLCTHSNSGKITR